MKKHLTFSFAALLLGASFFGSVAAQAEEQEHSIIRLANYDVPVIKDGLYDRFRSNPPLSVIAAESPQTDLNWFKTLQKTKVDIGFESYSPNFYYENSKVTVIYTADLNRLRELMPAQVLDQVQPLQVWPGRGLVALTAYAYHYCDNDSYNEISLAIVTNKPGKGNWGPLSLAGQSLADDFWGYVLKLPVDTELAKVRGVVGYNLPKWLTGIHLHELDDAIQFEVMDQTSGKVDFTLTTRKLDKLSSTPTLVTNSFINLDQRDALTYGYAVSRHMSYAYSTDSKQVNLELGDGELSRFMQSLDLGKMVKYDYVPSFQSALYAPKPLANLK